MEPKTIFDAFILILMAFGIAMGFDLLTTTIMKAFEMYMNRKPRVR